MKGYKVFNSDWTCRGFQYEVGKTYEHEGEIKLCGSGFHYCRKLIDCFKYYTFDHKNKVAEIEALGLIKSDGKKSVTDKMKIVKELTWYEVLDLVNLGHSNTGYSNSGNWNSGNCNSGNWNSGNWNSGDCNSGDCNSGYSNSGNRNSGDYNSGNCNSGNCNTGNCNSGDCNSGDYNSGIFNSNTSKIYMFNKPSDWTYIDWVNSKAREIIFKNIVKTVWIDEENMTDKEAEENPDYEILGGYLKTFSDSEMWANMWNSITEEEKEEIKSLPNFDKDIFKEITGIEI